MDIFYILSFFICYMYFLFFYFYFYFYFYFTVFCCVKSFLMIKCFDFSSSDHRNTPTSLSLERPAICFCILNRDGENVSGHIPLRSGTFRMCALWSLEKKMTNFFHFVVFSFFLFPPCNYFSIVFFYTGDSVSCPRYAGWIEPQTKWSTMPCRDQ